MKKQLPLLLSMLLVCSLHLASQNIYTIAGGTSSGFSGDGGQGNVAAVRTPHGVAADAAGNLYIADFSNNRIRKVDAVTGIITTFAGTGAGGFNGDNISALTANLGGPADIFFDNAGDMYIAVQYQHRIRKITMSTGIITTVAGSGTSGYNGDGISATTAQLSSPRGVFVDGSGNIFIADQNNHRVRKVSFATGLISTIAGTTFSGYNGDNIAATTARLNFPSGVALDASGHIYIADVSNNRLRRVNASTGVITTVAGTGVNGYNGDGIAATTAQVRPIHVEFDAAGNIYIADNNRIRKITIATGLISTIAGNGMQGYNGEGLPATSAWINTPLGFCFDPAGNFYFPENYNHRVRKVNIATGIISTVAGNGVADGLLATAVPISHTSGSAVDQYGNVYIADELHCRVRKVDYATGIITTVAGNGSLSYNGDGIPAVAAGVSLPTDVAVDPAGNLYITDYGNHRIRKVDAATGLISTIVGTGIIIYNGDNIPATSATIYAPYGIELDAAGNVYFAEYSGHRVRKITVSTGIITTVAGTGTAGYNGDNIAASTAQINAPWGLGVDASGNVYIGEGAGHRVRKVTVSTGIITTIAGTGVAAISPNGIPATSAEVVGPGSICFDPAGNIYFTDRGSQRVRKIAYPSGIISTIAGTGNQGYNGDGIPATTAWLHSEIDVDMDASGNFIIADQYNNRMRFIQASVITAQPVSVSICPANNTTFGITASGTNYQWQVNTGAGFVGLVNNATYAGTTTTTLQITNATAGMNGYQYRCRVDGVYYSYVATLNVTALPSIVATASPSATVCSGSPLTLTGSGAISYSWSGGVTDGVPFTPGSSGGYTVTGTGPGGCTGTATIAVTVNNSPVVAVTGNSTICDGESTLLTASGASSYAWSSGGNASNETVSPSSSTTYSVVGTTAGCMDTATISITVNLLPTISVSGNTTLCAGDATTLTASGADTYSWSSGGTGTSEVIAPVSTTTITVTGISLAGCVDSATVTITVVPLPVVSVSGNSALCTGDSVTLTASGAATYSWSSGGNGTNEVVAPVSATTYTVTGMNGSCSDTATLTVSVNALPVVSLTGNTTVCAGDSTTITASGASGYAWSSGGNGASEILAPATTTSYTVSATDVNGCVDTATITVNVNLLPNLSVSGDTLLCAGESTTLTVSGAISYAWSTGGNSSLETITPPISTTITVTGTDLNSCSVSQTISVTVNVLPSIAVTGQDTTCSGNPVVLTATGGTTYLWSSGGTNPTETVSPPGTTTYTVMGTDGNQCSSSDSFTVYVHALPVITFSVPMDTACVNGGQLSLSSNPAGGIFSGTGVNGTQFDPFIAGAGWHVITCMYTDSNNCSAAVSDSVFVDPCMGINTAGSGSFVVSPNPSSGVLNLAFGNPLPGNSSAEIFDASGRIVFVQSLTAGTTQVQLNTETLESGLYVLRINGVGYHVQQRILVQR